MTQTRESLSSEVVDQLRVLADAVNRMARVARLMDDLSSEWVSYITAIDGTLRTEEGGATAVDDHVSPVALGQRRAAELLQETKSTITLLFELVARKFAMPHDVRALIERSLISVGSTSRDGGVADFAYERLLRMPPTDALGELAGRVVSDCERMKALNIELAMHMDLDMRRLRDRFGAAQ